MNDLLLIDLDLVCFKAAAACETRSIDVTHVPSGRTKNYKHRTEFKQWLSENPKWDESDFTIADRQDCEPESFCYNTIKQMIENIKKKTGIDNAKYFISGKGNFRLDLPLPTRYKSGRKDMLKPLLLKGCIEFVMKKYNPIVANNVEADDMLSSWTAHGYKQGWKWVGVTSDKDACQTNGWLFNPDKHESPVLIEGLGKLYRDSKGKVRGEGYLWLCQQWLLGDSTDGYCPSDMVRLSNPKFKLGEVGVFNMLKDAKDKQEAFLIVNKWYADMFPEPVTYVAWNGNEYTKSAGEIMQMYKDCALMREDLYGSI